MGKISPEWYSGLPRCCDRGLTVERRLIRFGLVRLIAFRLARLDFELSRISTVRTIHSTAARASGRIFPGTSSNNLVLAKISQTNISFTQSRDIFRITSYQLHFLHLPLHLHFHLHLTATTRYVPGPCLPPSLSLSPPPCAASGWYLLVSLQPTTRPPRSTAALSDISSAVVVEH